MSTLSLQATPEKIWVLYRFFTPDSAKEMRHEILPWAFGSKEDAENALAGNKMFTSPAEQGWHATLLKDTPYFTQELAVQLTTYQKVQQEIRDAVDGVVAAGGDLRSTIASAAAGEGAP